MHSEMSTWKRQRAYKTSWFCFRGWSSGGRWYPHSLFYSISHFRGFRVFVTVRQSAHRASFFTSRQFLWKNNPMYGVIESTVTSLQVRRTYTKVVEFFAETFTFFVLWYTFGILGLIWTAGSLKNQVQGGKQIL